MSRWFGRRGAGPPGGVDDAAGSAVASGRRGLRSGWRWRLLVLAPLYLAVIAVIMLSTALIYYTVRFPDPTALRQREQTPVVKVLARDGALIAERGRSEQKVAVEQLPPHVVQALLAIEDRRFFSHWGVDGRGLARAVLANLRAGRYAQGGSTLTQQLAKNLFLTGERRLGRKLEELVLAIWLELRLGKRSILELYLNRVYFGGGSYGIEAAARRYFDKPASMLTLAEAAVIAGLLKAPSRYSPASRPEAAKDRARQVLDAMREAGFISAVAHASALSAPIQFANARNGPEESGLEYAVEHVLERLPQLSGQGHVQIIVETTIDARIQRHAQATVARLLAEEKGLAPSVQAGLVMLDGDGAIRALVGGRGWSQSQFNRAIRARRQPGSAFKPIVYLAAVELGAAPNSIVVDQPVTIGGWTPRNDQGFHRGPITLRQSLAHSINTVAVQLQQDVGARRVAGVAERLGIASELRLDPSLALGTSEVTLAELTRAYATIARGGLDVPPHIVRRVYTSGGRVLYAAGEPTPERVAARPHAAAIIDMLNAAVVSGTGRRAALPRHPAAGKTGTTQDYRDAWFIGFTSHLVAGVWVGNDANEPMDRVAGGGLPSRIWHEVMVAAHRSLPPRPLPGQEPAAVAEQRGSAPGAVTAGDPIGDLIVRKGAAPRPDAPAPPAMPKGSIDPALFEAALGKGHREKPETGWLDFGALQRLLGTAVEGSASR